MSCMSNIDPYNNAPPSKCGSGSCGPKPPPQQMSQPYPQPPQPPPQIQQYIPQYAGKTNMTRRPLQTPGRPDPVTENEMLRSDLQTAIQYIYQLGGVWPPPGH
jgi:hypothetical protein